MAQPPDEMTPTPPEQLDATVQEVLRRRMTEVSCRAGSRIFDQGMNADDLYLVSRGRVKVVRVTHDGKELILCMPGPGEPFCPVTALDGGPQLGAAYAVTDVTLLHAKRDDFFNICRDHPEVLSAVRAACLGEVRRLAQRLEMRSFSSLKQRLASVLLEAIRIQKPRGGTRDTLYVTQQELADIIGASRERVSLILTEWREAGLVATRRGVVKLLRRDEIEKML